MVVNPVVDFVSPPSPSDWHALETTTSVKCLDSDRSQGLSLEQVAERLRQYGTNELQIDQEMVSRAIQG
ncbi:MAG: cation-transporting P-type ATPase [Thermosynechococcaceae cyanobacterium]